MSVISDKNNFLFIHVPKNAGTSVRGTMVKKMGATKVKGLYFHADANYLKDHLGSVRYQQLYKFGFLRNPWARMVSKYHFMRERLPQDRSMGNVEYKEIFIGRDDVLEEEELRKYDWVFCGGNPLEVSFEEWLLNSEMHMPLCYKPGTPMSEMVPYQRRNSIDWLKIGEEIAVDHVCNVATAQKDFDIICDKVGLKKVKLPTSNRSKHKPYQQLYSKEARDFVEEHFQEDIRIFNYRF